MILRETFTELTFDNNVYTYMYNQLMKTMLNRNC